MRAITQTLRRLLRPSTRFLQVEVSEKAVVETSPPPRADGSCDAREFLVDNEIDDAAHVICVICKGRCDAAHVSLSRSCGWICSGCL